MGSHKHPNPKALAEASLQEANRQLESAGEQLAKVQAGVEDLRISAERAEEHRQHSSGARVMPWYNPLSWFRRRKPVAEPQVRMSRRAVDSSDLPFECVFHVRLPSDMREDGGRVARAHGFSSLGEFMRFLLNAEIRKHFDHVDKVFDESPVSVTQTSEATHAPDHRY